MSYLKDPSCCDGLFLRFLGRSLCKIWTFMQSGKKCSEPTPALGPSSELLLSHLPMPLHTLE
ncbi:hypothetical protein LCGC14_2897160, partial [marine sediment metagenome]